MSFPRIVEVDALWVISTDEKAWHLRLDFREVRGKIGHVFWWSVSW